jgi:hypothetical protein
MGNLELHRQYNFEKIEALAKANDLYEKICGCLEPFDGDRDLDGEIGDIVLPLYFQDGSVAANFILIGYGFQSVWRCIYISHTLSTKREHEV